MFSTEENYYDPLNPSIKGSGNVRASHTSGVQGSDTAGDYRFMQNMQKLDDDINRSQDLIDLLGDKSARERFYREQRKEFFVPKDSELRRRRNFVLSNNAVDDAIESYYSDTVYPLYRSESDAAKKRGEEEYVKYISVPGANQHAAMGAMHRATDPVKVAERTMEGLDNKVLDSVAGPYARYARLSPEGYRDSVLKPALHNRVMDEMVEENTPKSSVEYVARSAYDNSLAGKMMDFSQSAYSGTKNWRSLNDASLANYDSSRLEDFAANVGALAGDSFLFYGIGGAASKVVGGATSLVRNRLANSILSKGAANGVTADAAHGMARKYIVDNIGARIAQSSATQALTLGTYDAANSVYNDLVHGDDVDVSSAASSFAHGAGTGTLLGVVGTPLRTISQGLTGARRMAASAGVLSAESAVFTLGTEIEKASSGIEVEPIDLLQDFGESAATLLSMRMLHWRPSGAGEKLNSMGRLKHELRFTPAEAREIADAGVDPAILLDAIESSLKTGSNVDAVKSSYLKMMSGGELSAATRAKLLYIVENKLTSTPPLPVGYTIRKLTNGGYMATTYNVNGGRIESKEFSDRGELDAYVKSASSGIKRNRITAYENMIARNYDSQSFFRQAGFYAKEKGIAVDVISETMYKKANKEPLSDAENTIVDEIFQRSGYASDNLADMLNEMRSEAERVHNLDAGSLVSAMDKPYYRQTKSEAAAIHDYELLLRDEARRLLGKDVQKRSLQPSSFEQQSPGTYKHTISRQHELQSEVERLGRNLGVNFNIIYSDTEIPRNHPEYNDIMHSAGWYDARNNTLNINLSKLPDLQSVRDTVIHETVGHYGLQKVFGRYYIDFLNEVYERSSADVKARIDTLGRENNYGVHRAVDEYMAQIAEQGVRTAEQRSLMSRFKYFVKDMFNRMNIFRNNDGELSEQKLNEIIERHYLAMRRGRNPEQYRNEVFRDFETAGYKNVNSSFDYYTDAASAPEKYYVNNRTVRNVFNNSNHYRFIGEKGMRNMAAQGDTYLSKRLEEAQKLLRQKANPHYIKYKTGWEVGADGAWRFEIADDIKVKDYLTKLLKYTDERFYDSYLNIKDKHPEERTALENRLFNHILYRRYPLDDAARLQDIVKDNMFFSAYPELQDMPVRFEKLNGPLCQYNPQNGELMVDMRAFSEPSFGSELAVQMQRIIQDYEDFSRGYNMARLASEDEAHNYEKGLMMSDMLKNYDRRSDFVSRYGDSRFEHDFGVPYNEFRKRYPTLDEYVVGSNRGDGKISLQGNVELRNVARRYDWSDTKRQATTAEHSEDYPRSMQLPSRNFEDVLTPWCGPVDVLYEVLRRYEGSGEVLPPRHVTQPTPMQRLEMEDMLGQMEKDVYRNYYRSLKNKKK